MARSATAVVREQQAERNAAEVLAESSYFGERRVAVARVAMIFLLGGAREVIAPRFGVTFGPDRWGFAVSGLYASYAITTAIVLYTIGRPGRIRGMVMQLLHATIDFAFIAFMAWRSFAVDHRVYPELGAAVGALLIAFSVARAGLIHVVYSTTLACIVWVLVGVAAHTWSPYTGPFVLGVNLALGLLIGTTNRSVHTTFRGLRARDNLSRFLPRPIVERVLAGGDHALRPTQTEVTVLFSDLRDFTTLSESLSPSELLTLLDEYFGHMSQIVKGHDGIVNKFIGDGMLAFWNVPEKTPAHAQAAVRAALDMRARLADLNQGRERRALPPLRFGVGIHTGRVAAGMLGGADQHEYTVIGDAVNVASRIEGLTKSLGTDLLVSDATLAQLGDAFVTRSLGDQQVKGRAGAIGVHAVEGRRG